MPEEGKEGNDGKDGKAEPQELEKNTEHGFWTATPIWSSESASSGQGNLPNASPEPINCPAAGLLCYAVSPV